MASKSNRATARGTVATKRRKDILAAATMLFYTHGYADTSVEDVASAVGVLKGSLYYYIDSKEDLLVRILEDVHEQVGALLAEMEARSDLGPLDRLSFYVRRQVDYNARNVRKIAVYYHEFKQVGDVRLADIRRQRRQHEQCIVDVLQEAVDAGEARPDLDTDLAARAAYATMIWPYTWYRSEGRMSAQQLADFCADFVIAGVRAGCGASDHPTQIRAAGRHQ